MLVTHGSHLLISVFYLAHTVFSKSRKFPQLRFLASLKMPGDLAILSHIPIISWSWAQAARLQQDTCSSVCCKHHRALDAPFWPGKHLGLCPALRKMRPSFQEVLAVRVHFLIYLFCCNHMVSLLELKQLLFRMRWRVVRPVFEYTKCVMPWQEKTTHKKQSQGRAVGKKNLLKSYKFPFWSSPISLEVICFTCRGKKKSSQEVSTGRNNFTGGEREATNVSFQCFLMTA